MTDAREIADKYTGLYLSGGTDKYLYLSDAIYDAVMEAAESQLSALAAKDAENTKQAAEIERLKKSAADDTLLFIAHNKQMNELKDQIEQLQARVNDAEKSAEETFEANGNLHRLLTASNNGLREIYKTFPQHSLVRDLCQKLLGNDL